ncbi:DUF3810 domain-containing protein [Anaerolentibacter hominis]|uniref:DUF3810 domain-containing protein n=1 Tax=Anaerolentibacter hominis TaxID=3079009 RepID=UPI0031B834EC
MRKRLKKKLWMLLAGPVGMILILVAQTVPDFAEKIYAGGIYRGLSAALSGLTGLLPFSLMEVGIVILIPGVLWIVIRFVMKLVKEKETRKERLISGGLNILCAVSLIYFIFVITCGVNYYRYYFTQYSGLEITQSSTEELAQLVESLRDTANDLRKDLPEDAQGVVVMDYPDYKSMAEASREAMVSLGEVYPVLAGPYPRPKPVLFSRFMSYTRTTGVFSCFTMEANVNTDVTGYTIPASMCHELAHLKGFMREDEANYISYLACRNSDDIRLQYSGVMMALVYAGNQLYQSDAERYARVRRGYSDGVDADLKAETVYWNEFEQSLVGTVSDKVNDVYLKVQKQTDGTRSYGRMVDLLLAEYKQKKESRTP